MNSYVAEPVGAGKKLLCFNNLFLPIAIKILYYKKNHQDKR